MSKSIIKQLAKNAKLRLTNSEYSPKSRINSNIIDFVPMKIQKEQIEIRKMDTSYDDVIKIKIINLLNNDFDAIDPIAKLIDYPYYNSLDNEAKQKYILNLSSLYTEIKKEFLIHNKVKFY